MKILVVGYRFDAAGGLEIVSAGLAKVLAQLGHVVKCVAVNVAGSWQGDGYEGVGLAPQNEWMHRIHVRWPAFTSAARLRHMLDWCDVVIVCHCHLLPFVQRCSPRSARRPRVVAWLHGREVWGAYLREYGPALKQADLLVAVSKYTADTVVEKLGEQYRPIVIPNPVDTDVFQPLADASNVERWSLFTVGRQDADTQHKGYDLVLEALAILGQQVPSLPLMLTIGGDGPRLPVLRQRARGLGLAERVRFSGKLSRSELVRHLASAELFVFPSRMTRVGNDVLGEGFGVVNIEAAACGRPVLTSTHGGCPETITNGLTGILVDPTSATAIAEGIAGFFRLSPEDRDRMGRRGREFVVEQFSFPAYGQRLTRLLALASGSLNPHRFSHGHSSTSN